MNHRISPRADTDINSIWNYVAQDNPAAADRVEQEIQEAIEKLAKNPNFGHFRDDIAPRQYRFYRVFSYLIIYRIEEDTLIVVRVIHGARDLPKLI